MERPPAGAEAAVPRGRRRELGRRGRVGRGRADRALARAGKAFAEAHSANGAQALAWQRLSQKDYVTAAAWFQAARSWAAAPDEDPKTTEGLVIALRGLRRDDEAETLAYQGGEHDETLRGLYLETVADRLTRKPPAPPDAAGLQRFADAVVAAKSGNGAQALGWYSYNARQFAAAAAWFDKRAGVRAERERRAGRRFRLSQAARPRELCAGAGDLPRRLRPHRRARRRRAICTSGGRRWRISRRRRSASG